MKSNIVKSMVVNLILIKSFGILIMIMFNMINVYKNLINMLNNMFLIDYILNFLIYKKITLNH